MTSPLCPKAECVLPPGHEPGHSFIRSASPDELHAFHRRVREWVAALAVDQHPDTARSGAALIAAERQRQVSVEGWTPEHDAEHCGGELAMAGICYAACAIGERIYKKRVDEYGTVSTFKFSDPWPWDEIWDKRSTTTPSRKERVRMMVKAGALMAAEIDRLTAIDAARGDTNG